MTESDFREREREKLTHAKLDLLLMIYSLNVDFRSKGSKKID